MIFFISCVPILKLKMPKKIIGRIDKADFPLLDLYGIDIKIDTGAYTSSIHQVIVENDLLKCKFYDKGHPLYNGKEIIFSNYNIAKVKSSNGIVQQRFKVKTTMLLFNKKYRINLTLSTRDDMKYPILIGRRFLNKKFIVDVSLKNLSFENNKKQTN